MTREEEIINAAYDEAEIERQLKMHPQVFEQGFVADAKWADRTMIEKACEWLEQNAYLYCDDIDTLHESALIGDFRHVMKGGEQ